MATFVSLLHTCELSCFCGGCFGCVVEPDVSTQWELVMDLSNNWSKIQLQSTVPVCAATFWTPLVTIFFIHVTVCHQNDKKDKRQTSSKEVEWKGKCARVCRHVCVYVNVCVCMHPKTTTDRTFGPLLYYLKSDLAYSIWSDRSISIFQRHYTKCFWFTEYQFQLISLKCLKTGINVLFRDLLLGWGGGIKPCTHGLEHFNKHPNNLFSNDPKPDKYDKGETSIGVRGSGQLGWI